MEDIELGISSFNLDTNVSFIFKTFNKKKYIDLILFAK